MKKSPNAKDPSDVPGNLNVGENPGAFGSILLPDTKPQKLEQMLERCVREKRIVSLIMRNGERFHLQLTDLTGTLVTGRCRVLEWSPEMTRKILDPYFKNKGINSGLEGEFKPFFFADAISKFGKQAHVYSLTIDIENILAVAIDETSETSELPFTRIP